MRADCRDRVRRSCHIPCSMGIQSTTLHGLQEAVERRLCDLVESNPPLVERQSKPKPVPVREEQHELREELELGNAERVVHGLRERQVRASRPSSGFARHAALASRARRRGVGRAGRARRRRMRLVSAGSAFARDVARPKKNSGRLFLGINLVHGLKEGGGPGSVVEGGLGPRVR